jgi:hypothetical protein
MSTPPPPQLTLESFHAVLNTFATDGLTQVIVWRNGPRRLRPAKAGQSIRALQPRAAVTFETELRVVHSVVPYR